MNQAVTFEQFLQTKYVGQKRFSLEGGETLIPALGAIIRKGGFGLPMIIAIIIFVVYYFIENLPNLLIQSSKNG